VYLKSNQIKSNQIINFIIRRQNATNYNIDTQDSAIYTMHDLAYEFVIN